MNRDLMMLGLPLAALNLLALGVWIGTSRFCLVLAPRRRRVQRTVPSTPPPAQAPDTPGETRLAEDIERWRSKRRGASGAAVELDDGFASWIDEVESQEAGGESLPQAAASCRAGGSGLGGYRVKRAHRA